MSGMGVRIALLAGDEGVVRDTVVEGCGIKGPAVIVPRERRIEHNKFRGQADAWFREIPPERPVVIDPVLTEGCTFTGCTFEL